MAWKGGPTTAADHAHMRMRQRQNLAQCKPLKGEEWLRKALATTGHRWKRQATWGWRVFDFWNHRLGIAVEADGPLHDARRDAATDERSYRVSGILILRVPNFDEAALARALREIRESCSWNERRRALGLKPIRGVP